MGAGDEGVRVEEGEGLGVLAARVALELLAAHREGLEQARDGDCRASLCTSVQDPRDEDEGGQKRTWRAALALFGLALPERSKSTTVPAGASAAVAVVTETESERAHREDRASPRKPKVVTVSRSEKEASLEV